MAESASQQSNTKKLDEILRRLGGQPTIEEWHDLATVLSQVDDNLKRVGERVENLDEAINGNGKPGIKSQVHDLEKDMAGYNRFIWIVIASAITSVIAVFTYLAQTHTLP